MSAFMSESNKNIARDVGGELQKALETARTRLAIAMAAENKNTPPDRRKYFQQTDNQIRDCLRELRRAEPVDPPADFRRLRALQILKGISASSGCKTHSSQAVFICRILQKAVAHLHRSVP
jgi:hypothetical protein